MTNTTLAIIVIPVIATLMIAWAPTAVYAGVNTQFGTSAEVVKEGDCGVPGADVDGNLISGGSATAYHKVISNSKTSHHMLKCIKTDGINDSGKAQVAKGFWCYISGAGFTNDTKATISASGHVVMTCKYVVPKGGN